MILLLSLFFNPSVFLTPSPYGHSPYLICDEQRERIKSVACHNPASFLCNKTKHSNLLPCVFATQNIGEEGEL